jgi:hypothetical protein
VPGSRLALTAHILTSRLQGAVDNNDIAGDLRNDSSYIPRQATSFPQYRREHGILRFVLFVCGLSRPCTLVGRTWPRRSRHAAIWSRRLSAQILIAMKSTPSGPSQITSRQHVIPRSVLRRFARRGGQLEVVELKTGHIRSCGPDADLFVANRLWDQRSEGRLMGQIEQRFGLTAARVERAVGPLRVADHEAITRMFSLWKVRTHFARNPVPDTRLKMVRPERAVSPGAMDEGEHVGLITMHADGTIPGRMIAGPLLQFGLDRQIASMPSKRWGIVRAGNGEFVLPDSFGDFMVMPLSPTCSFIADHDDDVLELEAVSKLNAVAKASSTIYLAARSLSHCPGV